MITLRTSLTGVFLVCRQLYGSLLGLTPPNGSYGASIPGADDSAARHPQRRGRVSCLSTFPGVGADAVSHEEATT
ncbi:hypothetical protein GCM10010315_05590 [Streptomyces luteosporeus]|uniref:Secreted protein n=1 Tax=Streptomyces luteosporeus TaxID=173856 RepID=A0ABN3TKS6_9ACTN